MSRGVGTIVKCWFSGCPKNQISDDLGSSPAFPGIIFTHFGAQQRKANDKYMVRSTLLHLSCSGVPKGKISKFQVFCDFLYFRLIFDFCYQNQVSVVLRTH